MQSPLQSVLILLATAVPVVVRTRDDTDIERLKAAGAAEVVAEISQRRRSG